MASYGVSMGAFYGEEGGVHIQHSLVGEIRGPKATERLFIDQPLAARRKLEHVGPDPGEPPGAYLAIEGAVAEPAEVGDPPVEVHAHVVQEIGDQDEPPFGLRGFAEGARGGL